MPSSAPQPRVSVVLPVRNGAGYLPAALASLQAQSEPNWELVAVDDGSTDDSLSVLQSAARSDPRVQAYSLPPSGLVCALNAGLAAARAPFIARLDADDVAHPHRLELQCGYLDRHPEIGLVSSRVAFGGDPKRAGGYQKHVDWLNALLSPEAIQRGRFIESPLAHPSVVFRRRLLDQYGVYRDGDFPEDYDLWLRWLEAGVRMAKLPETLLQWMDSPGRLSRTCPRYSVAAFYRLKAHYVARWLRREIAPERPIWIWGAGRVTRTRVQWLLSEGVQPEGWIDIDPRKIGLPQAGRPVRAPDALLAEPQPFILVYVASWDAREIITDWLERHAFREETDFLLCA